jgi:hypothetical protein
LLLAVLKAREFKIKALAHSVSGEGPFILSGTFYVCLHIAEEADRLPETSFIMNALMTISPPKVPIS